MIAAGAVQVFVPLTLDLALLLSAGIWWATRMKRSLGEQILSAQVGATSEPLRLDDECATRIRALSVEPFLLKQTVDGLRVQIANRPVVPVALFADSGVEAALTLAATQASERFGQSWVALASLDDDDVMSLRRLA
jgi:hypothetical protein